MVFNFDCCVNVYLEKAIAESPLEPEKQVSSNAISSMFDYLKLYSASTIANSHREVYEMIYLPMSHTTFIPNLRLQEFRNKALAREFDILANKVDFFLQSNMRTITCWEGSQMTGGSETCILDPHVNRVILDVIAQEVSERLGYGATLLKDVLPFTTPVMCNNRVKTEYRIQVPINAIQRIVFCSEAKSVSASEFDCAIQALQIGADTAIHLSRTTNIPIEDCSSIGIMVYSNRVLFYGVYLVGGHYPVIVLLSPSLSFTSFEDRRLIVKYMLCSVDYILDSIKIIKNAKTYKISQMLPLSFSYSQMFFKPIRINHKITAFDTINDMISNGLFNVERLMHIYECLNKCSQTRQYVLFPVGLLSIPRSSVGESESREYLDPILQSLRKYFYRYGNFTLAPIMIFPFLKDHGKSAKPPRQCVHSYLRALCEGVRLLCECKVAHMDLRPENIMWKYDASCDQMELKLIDFEDAILFGARVRFVESLKEDSRYPDMPDQSFEYASAYHNWWFVVGIKMWLLMYYDAYDNYTAFTESNFDVVKEVVLQDYPNYDEDFYQRILNTVDTDIECADASFSHAGNETAFSSECDMEVTDQSKRSRLNEYVQASDAILLEDEGAPVNKPTTTGSRSSMDPPAHWSVPDTDRKSVSKKTKKKTTK